MALPLIAIVGRPNVGKSMLFNKIIGRRLSIVEDTPGVTRDRIYGESEWVGRRFRLVDTGGIEPNTDSQILSFMREQAQIAIDNADVIIFVTDIKTGLTASDQEVASMLQRSRKPIVLAVTIGGKNISDFCEMSIRDELKFIAENEPATAPAICWTNASSIFRRKRMRRTTPTWYRWPLSESPM